VPEHVIHLQGYESRMTYDAIVVGAGPNGLMSANLLADKGWSVLLLEAQEEVGGAVRSAEDVRPGFVHDTFSAFYPFVAASHAMQSLSLDEHGVRWRHAPAVLGHPFPDGEWALLVRDREVTAALMDRQHPGDGQAWLDLCAQWDRIGEHVLDALISPFPPVRHGLGALLRLPGAGGLDLVKQLLSPVIRFGDLRFGGRAPKILLAGNAGHSDIPPNAPGSGMFGLLMTMLAQTVGYPVPEGGASALSEAMARRLESRGGVVRCSSPVVRIDVERGRATGVRTASGERFRARRAVVADVVAPNLFEKLLEPRAVPPRKLRALQQFQLDPSTVKVDWALDGEIPWASAPEHQPGTFHVADSLEQMAVAQAQITAHAIPAHPFMLAGQMATCDPTRAPEGKQSVWAYTHVPQSTTHDAGDAGIRGVWDRDDCERFADRMQERIERIAPGFGSRILARRVLGPRQFEERDANLIGGAINGGTSQLQQEAVLRPVPGLGRPETGISGLYLGSASAHPGGGVHGGPGYNAARAALAHHRVRSVLGRG